MQAVMLLEVKEAKSSDFESINVSSMAIRWIDGHMVDFKRDDTGAGVFKVNIYESDRAGYEARKALPIYIKYTVVRHPENAIKLFGLNQW